MDHLLLNAIDFVPENTGTILIYAENYKDSMIVTVNDNRKVMLDEVQKKLFKKFYHADSSIKRKHDDNRLGLSICKGIIEQLGGQIDVSSDSKKGTIFSFILPRDGSI